MNKVAQQLANKTEKNAARFKNTRESDFQSLKIQIKIICLFFSQLSKLIS